MGYSNFVNLQDILGVNQLAADQMGRKTAKSVGDQAATASTDLETGLTTANNQVKTGTVQGPGRGNYTPSTDAYGHEESFGEFMPYTEEQANKGAAGTYAGPDENAFAATDETRDAIDRVNQSTGQQVASTYGLNVGAGNYSVGQNVLDAALTGSGPSGGNLAAIQQKYGSKFGGLQAQLDAAQKNYADNVAAAKKESSKNAASWQDLAGKIHSQKEADAAAAEAKQKAVDDAKEHALKLNALHGNISDVKPGTPAFDQLKADAAAMGMSIIDYWKYAARAEEDAARNKTDKSHPSGSYLETQP